MNTNVTNAKGLGAGAILLHNLAKHWWALALRGVASSGAAGSDVTHTGSPATIASTAETTTAVTGHRGSPG